MIRHSIDGMPIEIADGIYSVRAPFEDTVIYIYLIVADEVTVIDTGISTSPRDYLIPALEHMGIAPSRLRLLVNTHNHHDHRGGNASLREYAPNLKIACHRAERHWGESIEAYMEERYHSWGESWKPSPEFDQRVRRLLGEPYQVDEVLTDGDMIDLPEGRGLRVWAVPEHSPGHIALWEVSTGTLFTGDALQVSGTPFDQRRGHFPLYDTVAGYRMTLALFEATRANCTATAHFGQVGLDGLAHLVNESRITVNRMEDYVFSQIDTRGGSTLGELLDAVEADWPRYPRTPHLVASVQAHIEELRLQRRITEREGGGWVTT